MKTTTAFALLVLLASCAGVDTAVRAIDLATGETRTFSSQNDVPAGWAVCANEGCTVPDVPCQNLGVEVCSQQPHCRVKELWCSSGGCAGSVPGAVPVEPDTESESDGAESGAAPGGDVPPSAPEPYDEPEPDVADSCDAKVTCEYACVESTKLQCDEISDAVQCAANPLCSWNDTCAEIICSSDDPICGSTCQGSCVAKAPAPCADLDQLSCSNRSDCEWSPGVCPACASADGEACACEPFCHAGGTEPMCPEIGPPPPGYCPSGQAVTAKYDERGCVVGFSCFGGCPTITAQPESLCPGGVAVEVYDSQGCVVDYACEQPSDCSALSQAYASALAAARSCDPVVTFPGQCGLQVLDALGCGCPTRVDPNNASALKELDDLSSQWNALGCGQTIACPSTPCFAPSSSAKCVADGAGGGTCVDG